MVRRKVSTLLVLILLALALVAEVHAFGITMDSSVETSSEEEEEQQGAKEAGGAGSGTKDEGGVDAVEDQSASVDGEEASEESAANVNSGSDSESPSTSESESSDAVDGSSAGSGADGSASESGEAEEGEEAAEAVEAVEGVSDGKNQEETVGGNEKVTESDATADGMAKAATAATAATAESQTQSSAAEPTEEKPVQKGPFIDIFGDTLLSLEMVDETHAKLNTHNTNEALAGKKVIGLYFSADWCGPCRQFTPELVSFYDKMNARKGQQGTFEIVWISRCRDIKSYGQYFTHMKWLALPPEEALGARGQILNDKYKVKGIPHLVLLDELGSVITYDARNKIPQDKAGIGFPWRNPLVTLYATFVPKSLRFMIKSQVGAVKDKLTNTIHNIGSKKQAA